MATLGKKVDAAEAAVSHKAKEVEHNVKGQADTATMKDPKASVPERVAAAGNAAGHSVAESYHGAAAGHDLDIVKS